MPAFETWFEREYGHKPPAPDTARQPGRLTANFVRQGWAGGIEEAISYHMAHIASLERAGLAKSIGGGQAISLHKQAAQHQSDILHGRK